MKKTFKMIGMVLLTMLLTFGATSCGDDNDPENPAVGTWTGTNNVTVAGQFTYEVSLTPVITENADGTLTLRVPAYAIPDTQMGNLSLGEVTIAGIAYDDAKKAYYRNYGKDGMKMNFKAEKGGHEMFNDSYPFTENSEVTISVANGTLTVINSFQLGAMPFPIVSTFTGKKQ